MAAILKPIIVLMLGMIRNGISWIVIWRLVLGEKNLNALNLFK